MKRLCQIFVLSILGLLICTLQARGQTLPKFGHVAIVVLENTDYSSSVGSMPYLDSLVAKYGLATNYYADTHPSIGNYFTLTTGQILTNDDSATPSSFPISQANIASLLQAAGKTWKDYPETSGNYIVRHDPLQYMTNINKANLTNLSQFKTDLANHALPNFFWIEPNGCNSAHDCGLSTADSWLQSNIDPLVKSTYFQPGGDGLLIIVFDESGGSGGTNSTGTTAGGQVECVIVSPSIVSAGFKSTTRHYHESLLRLMEQGLGLTAFAGSSASANNMSEFFGASAASTVSLSPTSLTFANQTVGTTSAAQVSTLTNTGSTTITISSITISGDFALAGLGTCGTSLAPGTSCTTSVNFTPTTTGTRTGAVTVNDSATGSPQTISLTGSGVSSGTGSPAASLSPTSLTFGNQNVGTTSATQAVTLSNRGTAALSISGIAITGTNSGDFAQSNTCGSSVAASASCTINVTFAPTASGTRTATVTVTDNATGSPHTAGLTGSGVSSGTGGTNYYVSTSGSDSNNGSASSPWATIVHAASVVGPGATVHVAPGTYSGQFNTSASGTSSAYITYVSDTKWGAKIAGGSSSTWSNYGAYVAIQGFDVTGPTGCCNAIYTAGNATQIIGNNVHGVQNSNGCSSTGGGGIVVDSTNAKVIGNYAHDNGPSSACNYIHGIYIANSSNPGSGAYVANNISFRNSGWGIQLWHSATQETLVNNTIFNNLTGGIVVGAGSGSGVTDDNTVVNNNIVYNNPGTDGGIVEEGTTGTHNTYANNLVYGNTPVNISLQNGLTATGTVSANPLFVNYTGTTTGDYHLQSSSPAINAGTSSNAPTTDYDGNSRPQAGAWDIGAYEYAGSSTSSSVSLSPASLTFANQNVGTTSAAQAIALSNTGSAALSITSIAVTGTNSGDFAQSNTCGTSVAAGGNCSINLTFTPAASGTRTASVTITDNASGSPQTVALTGSGVTASTSTVTLSPISLSFGSQAVATTSAAQFSTLTNTGSATVTITSMTISGDFAFAGLGTCGASLAAGANCTISVNFTPTVAGTRTGTVTVNDSATGSPQTVSLTGAGGTAGSVTLSPVALTFANQNVGTTSAGQTLTLTNSTSSAVTISSTAVTGTNSGDFAQSNTCGASVAAGASCAISVTFKPTASGARTAAVTVTDSATGSPQTASLTGSGVAVSTSTASLSPTSLTFASQNVGTTSAAQALTLSNTGSAALSITSVAVTGTNSGDFAQSNTCGTSVAAGASCTISVTFAPAASGTRVAAVAVTDNATGSPQTATLTGTGASTSTGPVVSLSPASLTFASQTVGTTSATQFVTLTNTGNSTLTFSGSFVISGDFHFAGLGTCGSTVAAGASCTLSVNFTPTAAGTRTGAVTLSDNAPTSPQAIPLSGTGGSTSTAPAVSLSPTSLTFGNQTVGTASVAQAVTLSNTGNATLTISSLTIGGDFAFAGSGTCGSSVAAGASCTISVNFTPTTTGTRAGTVTIADNASNSPQTIGLTGSGVSSSGGSTTVSVSPASLSFGKVKIGHTSGSQTVTVSNTGTASVTLSSVTISGQFADTNTCGGSLAVGASCAINVASAPTSSGTQTGTLTISDNASGSPQMVSLTGSGH